MPNVYAKLISDFFPFLLLSSFSNILQFLIIRCIVVAVVFFRLYSFSMFSKKCKRLFLAFSLSFFSNRDLFAGSLSFFFILVILL